MKNIQIVDGANNATLSIFQATDEEFERLFPADQDMELIEDLLERLGEAEAIPILNRLWTRPVLKRDAMGLHGTLFYDNEHRRAYLPASKREVDWNESAINHAQRILFRAHR